MKKKKVSIIILLIALSLVLFLTLKDDFTNIISQLYEVNKRYFIIAILMFFMVMLLKSVSLKIFLQEYKKDYSLFNAFKLTLISQFLNGITPFQSGGQPFQIYLLKKDGIRISDSTNAMLKDFIAFQISLILMGFFAIFANLKYKIVTEGNVINSLIFLGFFVNFVILAFLILVISSKRTVIKIITKFLNYIYRFKFMSKLSIKKEKLLDSLDHFYETGSEIRKNKGKMIIGIISNILALALLYLIPFVIFVSLDKHQVTPLYSIVLVAFVMLIGNFIPIPGATGGLEYSFIKFFGIYVNNPVLSSAMLLWRFVTYIFGMIVGFINLIFRKRTLNDKSIEGD